MRLLIPLVTGALLLSAAVPAGATPAGTGTPDCFDRRAPVTYEEGRLDTPALPGGVQVPSYLIEAGGFAPYVRGLAAALCHARTVATARVMLRGHGAALWRAAVARAQGRVAMGTIDRYDDRPLYWSRLTGTRDIRQWRPGFALSEADRAALLRTYEYAARGVTSTAFGRSGTRVLVSGFDPYQLNGEIRRSNPSGGAALQLDGRVLDGRMLDGRGLDGRGLDGRGLDGRGLDGRGLGSGRDRVRVQAVMLPVTWSGFDAGIVEDAFGPHLLARPGQADLIMTISQGGRGVMNIEQWAGAWRGGSPDNNNEGEAELIPPAPRWPQPDPGREFIETTLPYPAMIGAGTGPWPVALNPTVCQWPAGTRPDGPFSCTDEGPAPGAQAQSGGGGNYLSNESMYRSNRLRLALGATGVPGGHLHISALVYPADPTVVIDDAFAADRRATIEQTVALVAAAGAAA
ncbi:hypothetical protein [Mangrovihabitans endophyticus]|uniref:Pyrrolidone-carboxylate peptidase (N-terminal pyroglutamyl peptidase) n=1 Tax=Mangrovihabitans endophyticus TaxID=1751298 RepID=A0A8J3C498_9ACTN|nr:hypothetical protein [Mangrovihabitans endophyticus]GGL16551.1 hypothetical protein GCM10012284_58940 [Mangrovihabitans endophyticus]